MIDGKRIYETIRDGVVNNAMIELFMIIVFSMFAAILKSVILALMALLVAIVWLCVLAYLLYQQPNHNGQGTV